MQDRTELGLIIDGHAGESVHPADVEEALASITDDWEWQEMDFIKDVRMQEVQFQDEVPPNPPVDMRATVVALRQVPTMYVDSDNRTVPYLDDPLHDLVEGLYREIGEIHIHTDAIQA